MSPLLLILVREGHEVVLNALLLGVLHLVDDLLDCFVGNDKPVEDGPYGLGEVLALSFAELVHFKLVKLLDGAGIKGMS